MGLPAFGVENFFSDIQFSGHTISANEEATDHEAFRVGNARRSSTDHWTPTTANIDAWVKTEMDQSRSFDYCAIDRGHNLGGETLKLQKSTDAAFTSPVDVFSVTFPTTVSADSDLDAANGVLTSEGAWIKRFASTSSQYVRIFVSAMGAGLKPVIVNLWVGALWEPGALTNPFTDEDDEPIGAESASDTGWIGHGLTVRRRIGELHVQLPSIAAYTAAANAVRDNFNLRRPMWIVHDDDRAERAVLGIRPRGRTGFRFAPGWGYRQADINWLEHEAKVDL